MSAVRVTTQAKLDAALKAGAAEIDIHSPKGVWLAVWASGSSTVRAYGSSTVTASGSSTVWAYDSSTVWAYDSSTVTAYGSSTVRAYGSSTVWAYDSSTVRAYGSSTVRAYGSSAVWAYDSSTVWAYGSSAVRAYGSSTVTAYGSSTVWATPYVAVHLHSQRVKLEGGVVIDLTKLDLNDAVVWCEFHGVRVVDGVATLFKALDAELNAGHSYRLTGYTPGETLVCSDWRDTNACGHGLHLSPSTGQATAYRTDAKRWVRCEVDLADIRPINQDGMAAKCKVRSCRVVAEVDAFGRDLVGGAA